MNIVHIIPNEKDPSTWTTKEVENVLDYLVEEFGQFPKNARIYHGSVAYASDVTPAPTMADIERFKQLDGTFYVVIKPSLGPLAIIAIVSAVVSAISVVAMLLLMPKMKTQQQQSPNNELNSRQNTARLKGRIPDIYGTVRSYPDQISETYTYYENETGIEVERSLLAIGRGRYKIQDVKDASTHVADIPGTSISIYDPNTSILGNPIFQAGGRFNDLPLSVIKSKSITGQTIANPNDKKLESGSIYFDVDGSINVRPNSDLDFTEYFQDSASIFVRDAVYGVSDFAFAGEISVDQFGTISINSATPIYDIESFKSLVLTSALVELQIQVGVDNQSNPVFENRIFDLSGTYSIASVSVSGNSYIFTMWSPSSVNPTWSHITNVVLLQAGLALRSDAEIDLSGTYTVESVTSTKIRLVSPELTNADWLKLSTSTIGQNALISLDDVESKWIGWHNMVGADFEGVCLNVYYPRGMYWQSKKSGNRYELDSTVVIEYQKIVNDEPVGPVFTYQKKLTKLITTAFGYTHTIEFDSPMEFRFRVSKIEVGDDYTADECKLKDVYGYQRSTKDNYGNITVIQSITRGTDGALSIKERKLNCLVTRMLKIDGFGAEVPTNQVDQILINMALDPFIGRRSIDEVDISQIKSEIQAVRDYFGSEQASEFCYTISDQSLSFEETVAMVASAAFCEATRFGNQLRLYFERPQTTAKLLFNHRNKVPKSEKRTYSTVIDKEYDGVEIEYTDPKDDARITYVVPENSSVTNPLKIDSSGIRNHAQAKTRAWREWNKLQYRRVDIEFQALDEANILVRNNMIMVADNTREKTQDGQVLKVEGLKLTLSQNVDFNGQASIYLQMPNGTVDVIGCQLGEFSNEVILNRAPLYPLVVESDRYVKTVYQVVKASEKMQMFLLASAEPASAMTHKLTAYNYDQRYYSADHNFF